MAGILGASLAPYIATWLAGTYGLRYVGYYLTASAVLTLFGALLIRETKDNDLSVLNDVWDNSYASGDPERLISECMSTYLVKKARSRHCLCRF
jgi:hypothetical protein